jgi:hypothetical protein
MNIDVLLLILGFICFVLAAFGVSPPRVSLTPLGLALWVLSLLI